MTRDTSGLARGTEVRSRRADLKRRIRSGDVSVPELLEGEGDEADEVVALDMSVYVLAKEIPSVGHDALLALAENGFAFSLHASTRLAHLTVRRRRDLAAALRKETQR